MNPWEYLLGGCGSYLLAATIGWGAGNARCGVPIVVPIIRDDSPMNMVETVTQPREHRYPRIVSTAPVAGAHGKKDHL
jgi:hypothetical protein